MAELEIKTLSSLETDDSLNDGDKVLIERDGDMIRVDSSAIGGGSGGGYFLINVTFEEEYPVEGNIYGFLRNVTFDKTFDQIKEAYDSGLLPIVSSGNGSYVYFHLKSRIGTGVPAPQTFVFENYSVSGTVNVQNILITYKTLQIDETGATRGNTIIKEV